MSDYALTGGVRATTRGVQALIVTSYAALGSILCGTRLAGLDRSYWHDEIVTVADYVRAGPREILAGPYIPNNHELFSLFAWATSSLVGESEVALRLWSVIPFILGVILVAAWLHVRVGPLSGVLFLFYATVSPLLLDLSRQARGYGLAFLAMAALIVAALEADRSGRTRTIVALCAAGLVGTWTLPNFGIAFFATGAVLLTKPQLRRRVAFGLGASTLAIGTWYAPHVGGLLESSRQEFGVPISTAWVITAPIDQILMPALVGFDVRAAKPDFGWLPIIAALLLLMSASPLLRAQRTSLILGSGVVATVATLWITRTLVLPRFLSFLLVPLLILVASGTATILARPLTRPPITRTVVALTTLILLTVAFASPAARVTRLPREAHKDAADAIRARASPSTPVFAYMLRPRDLVFYLERPVSVPRTPAVASRVCSRRQAVVLVTQPWALAPASVPCVQRPGVRHYRFEQYTRGGEINVWFIPALGSSP